MEFRKKYTNILEKEYRWETWAAPKGKDGKIDYKEPFALSL
jgi:type I restriction enzyme M protein